MGVIFDYFRARDAEAAQRLVGPGGVNEPNDVVTTKWVDSSVVLGRLVAFIDETSWTPDLAEARLVAPDPATGPKTAEEYEALPENSVWLTGPYLEELELATRDSLAGVDDARLPTLAEQWAMTEELANDGRTTGADLLPFVRAFVGLARRARAAEERLYCRSIV